MTLFSYVLGASLRNSVVVAVTSTRTPQKRPIWCLSKLRLHTHPSCLRVKKSLLLCLMSGERFSTLRRRERPWLGCWTIYLPSSEGRMLGRCARHCTELAQLQRRGEMSCEKGSAVAISLLVLCRVAASTMSCASSRGRCMAMTFLSLALSRDMAKMG